LLVTFLDLESRKKQGSSETVRRMLDGKPKKQLLILGSGFGGLYTALQLEKNFAGGKILLLLS